MSNIITILIVDIIIIIIFSGFITWKIINYYNLPSYRYYNCCRQIDIISIKILTNSVFLCVFCLSVQTRRRSCHAGRAGDGIDQRCSHNHTATPVKSNGYVTKYSPTVQSLSSLSSRQTFVLYAFILCVASVRFGILASGFVVVVGRAQPYQNQQQQSWRRSCQ